jgi:hypothetical protein
MSGDGITTFTLVGFWVWGVVTVSMGIAIFGFIFWAAFNMQTGGTFPGASGPRREAIYNVLKDHGTVVAAALAASALAWSYFFAAIYKLK